MHDNWKVVMQPKTCPFEQNQNYRQLAAVDNQMCQSHKATCKLTQTIASRSMQKIADRFMLVQNGHRDLTLKIERSERRCIYRVAQKQSKYILKF